MIGHGNSSLRGADLRRWTAWARLQRPRVHPSPLTLTHSTTVITRRASSKLGFLSRGFPVASEEFVVEIAKHAP